MNTRQLFVSAILSTALPCHAALVEFNLGPVDASGAGMHPGNAHQTVSSLATGGELNTRNPELGGITYDPLTKVLEINIGWGTMYGFTDLAGPPNILEIGGPTSVPRAEANGIYNLISTHPGFVGETTRDGYFTGTLTLQNNPGSLTYSIAEQEQDLMNGLWYLNLRTSAYPGGEIRGQLTAVPEPSEWALLSAVALVLFACWARRNRNRPA